VRDLKKSLSKYYFSIDNAKGLSIWLIKESQTRYLIF